MATVLVPLAQGCEELEAVTIIDLLRRAGIKVITAGLDDQPVTASRGVVLIADTTIDQVIHKDFDMIVLPGGLPGATNLQKDPRVQQFLKDMHNTNRYTAAICAAPKALASAGLLDNRRATSYPGSLDACLTNNMTYLEQPVVVDGKVITSRGPGTAMDFSLTLIELLAGKEKRREVEAALMRP
ncbi:MAG: DJ-1/PfpI family protein [Gammaproteobacteria bacterium]|nr:DJ-1/PfpI family protein [Gammaproteobacteria bacterium]